MSTGLSWKGPYLLVERFIWIPYIHVQTRMFRKGDYFITENSRNFQHAKCYCVSFVTFEFSPNGTEVQRIQGIWEIRDSRFQYSFFNKICDKFWRFYRLFRIQSGFSRYAFLSDYLIDLYTGKSKKKNHQKSSPVGLELSKHSVASLNLHGLYKVVLCWFKKWTKSNMWSGPWNKQSSFQKSGLYKVMLCWFKKWTKSNMWSNAWNKQSSFQKSPAQQIPA